MVKAILFNAEGDDRTVGENEVCSELQVGQLLWIQAGVNETIDRARLCLPAIDSEVLAQDAPIVAGSGFYVIHALGLSRDEEGPNDLRFMVGPNWLISESDLDQPLLDEFIENDRGRGLRGNLTGTGLLVSLLLTNFEAYQARVSKIDDAIDKLDESILRSRHGRRMLDRLASLRARNAAVRRSFVRNRALVRAMTRPDISELIEAQDTKHIAHLASVYDRVEDQISAARDEVIASFELYATKVAQDTNELIKLLTVVTVTTGIVGAIAGIMGMNVEVPLKDTGIRGFYEIIGFMAILSLMLLSVARLRRWL